MNGPLGRVLLPALLLVFSTGLYLAMSALVGARLASGRMTADRDLEDFGLPGGLRSGVRPRLALETARHISIAGTLFALVLLPSPAPWLGSFWPIVAAVGVVLAGRLVETVVAPLTPDPWIMLTTPILFVVDRALFPFTAPITARLGALADRPTRDQPESDDDEREELVEEQLEEFIRDSEREGLLEQEQSELLREVVDTGDMVVKEVMTPRTEIAAVSGEAPVDELVSCFVSSRHSRLPVFDGTLDRVVGVVALRDLLPRLVEGKREETAREAMRPIMLVPGSKKILELLRELQREQQQMAVVVDEFGGTAGLVTLEDLIEEIVGEIRDEHEEPVEDWSPDGQGGYVVSGMMSLDDLSDLTGEELDQDGVETVGGLVFSRLGRVPQVGDEIALDSLVRFVVARMDGRRIAAVQVSVLRHEPGLAEEAGDP